ncbi:hypothetical protein AYX15_04874 [Cryptococcus neoformans]|nr:hypothetical protein AYX15_04874 [Cryptococcus neoformans var. grubii]
MVVTVITPHDLHRSNPSNAADALSSGLSPISFDQRDRAHNAGYKLSPESSSVISSPPPPIHISLPRRSDTYPPPFESNELDHAGPSHAASRPIPPPPNPRRHRSGILMSRVRAANGSSIKMKTTVSGSKSHGDLLSVVETIDDDLVEDDEMEELDEEDDFDKDESLRRRRLRGRSNDGWKRIVSEGGRQESTNEGDEASFWDNSARYYHHLHSHPSSRTGSITASPEPSPVASHSASPIIAPRSLSLPQNSTGPPLQGISKSLSPNQQFLQSRLPPTFPNCPNGTVQETHFQEHFCPAAMIFTPTTQEWKDFQAMPEWKTLHESKEEATFSGGSSEDAAKNQHSRHTSLESDSDKFLSVRPALRSTISAEYLGPEDYHTPDPGSPSSKSGEIDDSAKPSFRPNVISPSPVICPTDRMANPVVPFDFSSTAEESQVPDGRIMSHSALGLENTAPTLSSNDHVPSSDHPPPPARWNSIGSRDSLRVVHEPEAPALPRTKTKRELEREKLLKMVDEELEAENQLASKNDGWGGGVQQIGSGLGLDHVKSNSTGNIQPVKPIQEEKMLVPDVRIDPDALERPSSADPVESSKRGMQPSNPFDSGFSQAQSKLNHKTSLSPVHPFKPSPLNAEPIVAEDAHSYPSTASVTPHDTTPTAEIPPPVFPEPAATSLDSIRDYARGLAPPGSPRPGDAIPPKSPRSTRKRDTNRVSLVAGRVVQPFTLPASTSLPASSKPPDSPSLQAFSPFRSPALSRPSSAALHHPSFSRLDSTLSIAPSTGVPSECGTPTEEKAGGMGGRGIDDYVILKEAGKGAYGLVMRAKLKGPKGEPVGDEVIIKYIIKARILADCWKKHKVLGPIPVEIHVMDQLRHLLYTPPRHMNPWDPARSRSGAIKPDGASRSDSEAVSTLGAPGSPGSGSENGRLFTSTQKHIAEEIKSSPQRGHPNICKLVDFFEDKEFYYLVMPCFGNGMDLFDRVESQPSGLESFEVRSLIGQLSDAVQFLHANGIVHRDIKDENVILDGSGHCQLIDFGSAAHWRPGKKWDTFSGTLHYASPEILRGEMYGGKEQDIWALGVVTYVLLVGETPFSELPDEVLHGLVPDSKAYAALMDRCGAGHEEEGEESDGGGKLRDAADLVMRCMEPEVGDRPSAEVLLEHRYLRGRDGWIGKKGWVKV